jgi:hypothetical protein
MKAVAMPPNDCDRLIQNVKLSCLLIEDGELAPHLTYAKTVFASLGIHGTAFLPPDRNPSFRDPTRHPPIQSSAPPGLRGRSLTPAWRFKKEGGGGLR